MESERAREREREGEREGGSGDKNEREGKWNERGDDRDIFTLFKALHSGERKRITSIFLFWTLTGPQGRAGIIPL